MNKPNVSRVFGKILKLCGVATILAVPVSEATASCGPGDSVYIGSVCTTAINFCPSGYLPMNGQLLSISQFQALFALIGCRWGGNCRTDFAVPDMRGRSPVGVGAGPGLTPIILGEGRGRESHLMSVEELPVHGHTATIEPGGPGVDVTITVFDGNGASPTPSETNSFLQAVGENPFSANTTANLYGTGTGNPVPLSGVSGGGGAVGTVTIEESGGSRPFMVQGPVMALSYCMAVEGVFPPRD